MNPSLSKWRRRINTLRRKGVITCPASRHLHLMADNLVHLVNEAPDQCAESIYEVLEALWRLRAKHRKQKNR